MHNPFRSLWMLLGILGIGLLIGLVDALLDRGDTVETLGSGPRRAAELRTARDAKSKTGSASSVAEAIDPGEGAPSNEAGESSIATNRVSTAARSDADREQGRPAGRPVATEVPSLTDAPFATGAHAAHGTGPSSVATTPVSPAVPTPAAPAHTPTPAPAPTPAAPAASADAAYFAELGRIADMGADLSRTDIEALYRLLAQPSHPVLGHVEFHAVKNQALDKLLDQSPLPSDLGQTLVDLFRDRRHDELLRNYSLQHFEPYLRSVSSEPLAVGSEQAVAAVFAAYREALGESRNSISGVALLGLERATASDAPLAGHPDRALALRTAVRLAGDASCDPRSRLAAVQVCAVSGQTGALPSIRTLAADPATMTALRATALHALGELGDASDLSLLRSVSASGPPHVARVAASAEQSLQRRTAQ